MYFLRSSPFLFSKHSNTCFAISFCILTCYHPPSPGTSPALQAWGWRIVWSGPVPGVGGGANKKTSSLWLCEVCVISCTLYMMAADLMTMYFKGKTLEFVGEWLEWNNLSKLKSVFKGLLKYFFGKEGENYFFSLALMIRKLIWKQIQAFDIYK